MLKPLCTQWWVEALEELATKGRDVIHRGWVDSGLGAAFDLAKQGEDGTDYQEAVRLNEQAPSNPIPSCRDFVLPLAHSPV